MKNLIAAAALAVAPLSALAEDRTEAPEGAEVYIVNIEDGATLTNPVTIIFGLKGMGVAPAGAEWDDTGHHHLLVNKPLDEVVLNESLPADDNHRHFGGGQTEVTMDLPAGEHTLQLLLADWRHIPHEPVVVSTPITVTVE